ncbi:MAG: lysozyme inhibitor LprI family protein [Pseudomonadota bacterium]
MSPRRTLALCAMAGAMAIALPCLAGAGPSFDCAKARSKVEKAICGSVALSALDQRVATAYAKAMARLDGAAQAALRADQRLFLDARDSFFGTPDYDLKSDLADRAAWLDRVDPDAVKGWDGTWGSVMGEVTLSNGGRTAAIDTVALTQSHPTCLLQAATVPTDGGLIVGGSPADLKENDGWTVRLTRSGVALRAELLPPKGGDGAGGPPFCGHIASIGGTFLPLR